MKNEDNVKVFPNPATEYLMIDLKPLKMLEPVRLSLLSMIGEDVCTNQYPSRQQINLDLNSISCGSGIYMIRAETSSATY
ncbi:MAG: T9SS type A sorting domain-containing protein, partial [Bacteroidales bacterium]